MFPDYKKKTTNNFYNTKMKQSKIKRINLFPKNDYNVDDLIEKGIKYYKRGTSEEKEYQKKKYLDYIKKESENDYMKYYNRFYHYDEYDEYFGKKEKKNKIMKKSASAEVKSKNQVSKNFVKIKFDDLKEKYQQKKNKLIYDNSYLFKDNHSDDD